MKKKKYTLTKKDVLKGLEEKVPKEYIETVIGFCTALKRLQQKEQIELIDLLSSMSEKETNVP